MNIQRTAAIAIVGVLLLSGTALGGWWDDVGDAETVKLEDVIESPRAYKGKEITFTCTFHRVSKIFNPYYTRFVPENYLNFAVWSNSSRLWKKEDYSQSFSFMFLEKGHKAGASTARSSAAVARADIRTNDIAERSSSIFAPWWCAVSSERRK